MNKVILLGRMAREPEVRFTQGNEPTAVCRFSVAVDRPYSSRRTEDEIGRASCRERVSSPV